jgi:hypothetical protein
MKFLHYLRQRKFQRGPTLDLNQVVIVLYKNLLGRKPENPEVVTEKVKLLQESFELGLCSFLESKEYLDKISSVFSLDGQIEYRSSEKVYDELLKRVRKTWGEYADESPFWGVLTEPIYQDSTELKDFQKELFYKSGKVDVEHLLTVLQKHGKDPAKLSIFELGAGCGRLTWPLSDNFKFVYYSAINYLKITEKLLRDEDIQNASSIHLDSHESLNLLPKFDVFYSLITLQHSPPPIQYAILDKIFSNLNFEGLAVFQLVTTKINYSFDVQKYINEDIYDGSMEMHAFPFAAMSELLKKNGLSVLEISEISKTGQYDLSHLFILEKSKLRFPDHDS